MLRSLLERQNIFLLILLLYMTFACEAPKDPQKVPETKVENINEIVPVNATDIKVISMNSRHLWCTFVLELQGVKRRFLYHHQYQIGPAISESMVLLPE